MPCPQHLNCMEPNWLVFSVADVISGLQHRETAQHLVICRNVQQQQGAARLTWWRKNPASEPEAGRANGWRLMSSASAVKKRSTARLSASL